MSMTQGAWRPAGTATAIGLVPKSGSRLPKGASDREAGDRLTPMQPCGTAWSA
jgi:hypothetical protein